MAGLNPELTFVDPGEPSWTRLWALIRDFIFEGRFGQRIGHFGRGCCRDLADLAANGREPF